MLYLFGDYTLDTQLYELRYQESPCPLEPQVFDVLLYLIQHHDRIVTKQELLEHVWPDRFISEATLDHRIMEARQAVGDSGHRQRYIKTVRGRGYRFMAAVVECDTAAPAHRLSAPSVSPPVATALSGEGPNRVVTPDSALSSYVEIGETAEAAPLTAIPVLSPGVRPSVAARGPCTSQTVAGEWKQVTVLCCTLTEVQSHAAQLEPEERYRLMQAFFALTQPVLQRFEGTLIHAMHDGFMALFGAPVAHEDHARRAVLAAHALQHHLASPGVGHSGPLGETFTTCIGLHTGLVVVGNLGDDPQQNYTVVGDTTLLATRLCALAAPGTILLSAITQQLVQEDVRVEAHSTIVVAERSATMPVYRVRDLPRQRAGVRGHGARMWSRFVGRERELALLHERLVHVRDGQGQVVGIVGDPGIGKSRLLTEFHQSLDAMAVQYCEGHCFPYTIATPYLPVLGLLRQLCGITAEDSPEAMTAKVVQQLQAAGLAPEAEAPVLLAILDVPVAAERLAMLSPQARKGRIFALLLQMSVYRSQQQPLILALENAHWIDATSEEWLTMLVERLTGTAILLLVTSRPGYHASWLEQAVVTRLALPPLLPRDSLTVVQSVLRTEHLPEPLVPEILTKAAGNPFFLEELAWSIVEHGPRQGPLTVPETIQSVLAARIDRLPPGEKQLLQVAAVIGKDLTVTLLQAVTEMPEATLHASLRHLQNAEFVYETRTVPVLTYTFKHVLTQEVAYHSLLKSTRQRQHQTIAQVLETHFPEIIETHPELLAHHYTEAGVAVAAVAYWQRAGRRAYERSANREAISYLTNGLELLQTLPDTSARRQQEILLQSTLGASYTAVRGYAAPEVEQAYNRARDLCQQVGETRQLFPILVGLWNFSFVRGASQTACELGEQLLAMAQQAQDSARLLRAHAALGEILFHTGNLEQARQHLEHGVALYHPQPRRSHAVQTPTVACLAYMAWTLWQQGYPDQALQRCQEARELAQELSHPLSVTIALTFTGIVHQWRREAPAAQEWNEAATTLAQTQGLPFWEATAMIVWGWALAMQGQHAEGMAQIHRGLEIFHTTGAAVQMPSWLALLAEVYGLDGQIAAGQRVVDEALTILNKTGERYYEAELYRLKGDLALQHPVPDTVQAETCWQQALAVARRQGARAWELRAAVSLCRLWQRQGKYDTALQLLAPLYAWFTEGWNTADLQDAQVLLEALAAPDTAGTAGVTHQPTHSRERLLAVPFHLPPARWEHKAVVVLAVSLTFPSLTDTDALDDDPWTVTSRWTQRFVEAVEALGGVVLQRSPALLTAAFGLPRALDEMPQRAVQAAVAIQRLTVEVSKPSGEAHGPEMRLAGHLGEVLVDVQAHDPPAHLVALGDTLTLLVQLLGHARPGEILLSPQLGPQVETLYCLEARPLPLVAATANPIAYVVVGQRLQPVLLTGVGQRSPSPFVGRERELAVLHEGCTQVSAGQGQVVAIVGPAGIGKSRLLAEFRRSLQGTSVTYLEGQCRAYGRTTPYFPIRDLLRQHCGIADMDSPDVMTAKVHGTLRDVDVASETWAPYLLALLGVRAEMEQLAMLSSEAIKIRTFEALRLLALQSSQQRPLIVAVENMHWSDSTSEAYLAALAAYLPPAPILLLVTYRPEYRPPWSATPAVTALPLPMLSPDESRSVVQAVCQTTPLPEAVVQEILHRAEGNPFFLEELVRAVVGDGTGQLHLGTVPDTVQGVLMARIDRLPDDTKWCLQTAAVLGREAPHWLLTAVWSGPGDLDTHMQALQRLEFLYVHTEAEEPGYRFTHALTQEVAYESVPLPRRQALHTAMGRVLEALYADRLEAVADRLAYHYTRSAETQKAVTFLTLCAEKAVRTHAHTEAATAFEEALAQAVRLPEAERQRRYLEIALRQAFSWSFLGRFRDTLERLLSQQAVLERLADATLTGPYYFRLALTYWMLGKQEQAMQSAQHALAEAQRGHDVATLGKAHYVRALVEYSLGRFQQAIAAGWQSVEFLAQTEEWHHLGLMHSILGVNYGLRGEFAPALDALARVATIGAATGDPRLQSAAAWSTGWIAVLCGEWDAGIAGCQRGHDVATDPSSRALAANYLGFAYLDSGQPAQAMPLLQQAVEQFRRFRYLQGQGRATTWLGEAWLLHGDLATARSLAQQGLALSREARYAYGVGLAQRALGRIAGASGALAEAEHYYTDALETFATLSAQYELGRTYLDLATLAHTQANLTAVATRLTAARVLFEALQVPAYVERTTQLARVFEVSSPAGSASGL